MELEILYEDDILIAVNKPAGIVVHPTYKNVSGTLLDGLRSYLSGFANEQNPAVVGRLDKDTSGIVIAAKTSAAYTVLQQVLQSIDTEKDYLAVVQGAVDASSGCITFPLRVDPSDRRRVIAADDASDGWPAETQFQRLESRGSLTLLRCRLVSGRRHQIRVHLATAGWPVLGDRVYGKAVADFPRHALHSWRTSFTHPTKGVRIVIEAPIPTELLRLIHGR